MTLHRRIPSFARPAALLLSLTLAASAAHGAGFVKFDGIDGEAVITEFEITTTGPQPRASLLLPAVQKVREAASRPNLAQLACDGTAIPELTVEIGNGMSPRPHVRIKMRPVYITSYGFHATGQGGPSERVELRFDRAEWTNLETGETWAVDCSSGRCVCTP